MPAAARTATVGGRRSCTSRATHSMPATVSGGIDMTTSLIAGSSPISFASGTTSRSTPRLPIGSQWKREPLLQDRAVGEVERRPCSGPYGRRGRRAAGSPDRATARTRAGSSPRRTAALPTMGAGALGRAAAQAPGQEVRPGDQARSRLPSSRRRSAFSLMKPSASRWS